MQIRYGFQVPRPGSSNQDASGHRDASGAQSSGAQSSRQGRRVAFLLLGSMFASGFSNQAAADVDFVHDVAPILREQCGDCPSTPEPVCWPGVMMER